MKSIAKSATKTNGRVRRPPKTRARKSPIAGQAIWMLDLANDTIMIRDLNDLIVYWNHGAEQLYGWSRQDALGQYVHTFLKTSFPEPLKKVFERFLETGHWEGILEHNKKNGERITVASRWTLQRDREGKPAAYLEINNDITARVKAEQQLQQAHADLERRVAERTLELQQANEMLQEQIDERLNAEKALRALSLRLISAQEEERRRISRDLHDDLGQILVYISLDLERAMGLDDLNRKNEMIRKVLETSRNVHQRLGELSSVLRPPVLDDVGLRAAIQTYVSEFSSRTGIPVESTLNFVDRDVPEMVSTSVFRILQEALTNVMRHSGAKSVSIALNSEATGIALQVKDDGVGFDVAGIAADSHGISGMQERTELLGGSFAVATGPGDGTCISVSLPIREKEQDQ